MQMTLMCLMCFDILIYSLQCLRFLDNYEFIHVSLQSDIQLSSWIVGMM